jgi:DNA-binding beta-propeller fold protein YncE
MPLVPRPRKTWRAVRAAVVLAATALPCSPASLAAQSAPVFAPALPVAPLVDYWVYVGAESADKIYRVRFGPMGTVVEKTIGVGELAAEMEGPHGLAISADGKYLHMTTGHGFPDGKYWRYELGPDTLVGPGLLLGNFPASIDVTPDGLYALSVNFNLHGDMIPSTVSVIYTPNHTEVARIVTCTMPHGSRVSPDGMRQYSTCMMDDQLVEVDTKDFVVSRRFSLAKGKEGPLPLTASTTMAAGMAGMDHATMGHDMSAMGGAAAVKKPAAGPTIDPAQVGRAGMGIEKHTMAPASCSPTWAQPSANGAKIYVACNKANEILEIDTKSWALTRRMKTGRGVYNLAVTADGRLLVATLKQGNAVEVFDLGTGASVTQLPTSNRLAHGVTISADSRYAFVSSEGQGSQPGKVDVIDLVARAKVGTADVGPQASGIAFWKMTK